MKKNRFAFTVVALAVCRLAFAQGEATIIPGGRLVTTPNAPAGAATAPIRPSTDPTAPTVVVPLDETTQPRVLQGNDRVVGQPRASAPVTGTANAFRFEEAPLVDVVNVILRDVVKADYVIHPPLNGSVTLATRGRVSADQAVYMLEGALQANGAAMARDSRGVYHVGRPEQLRGIVSVPRAAGTPLGPGYGAIVVPLQYVGAAEMATILRPLLPPDALIRVDNTRNLLVLAGNRTQAEGWLSIVQTFDVDVLKGMSVGVYPLKYASVREVESALRLITPGGAAAAAPGQAGQGAPAAVGGDSFPLFGGVRIMPIERINSLLVVSPKAGYLEDARRWIEQFDQPGSSANEQRLHVYPVQNGNARHLADVLNGIFGGGEGRAGGPNGVAPGLSAASGSTPLAQVLNSGSGSGGAAFGTNNAFSAGGSAFGGSMGGGSFSAGTSGTGVGSVLRAGQAADARSPTQAGSAGAGSFQVGGVRVVADEVNNSILVYGTAADFTKIEAALRRLDLPATQVLIEASIVEVTLSDDLNYGLQWTFSGGIGGGYDGAGLLTNRRDGVTGFAAPAGGFSYTVANAAGSVRAVLNALATKSLVKVISSPSLMVLDNHTANIVVGDQQPIRSAQTITSNGIVSDSIQYKDTGVALAVTPSVTSGNMVSMSINQNVTDIGSYNNPTNQPTFLQRQINSKVAVRSGETLVLGGLIRDNKTRGSSGLPLLSDIPVIGGLFGNKTSVGARTELLVIITPRVVRSDQEARDVSAELRERMTSFIGHKPFGANAPSALPAPDVVPLPLEGGPNTSPP